ncbi:MAG TPA: NfeD family protein, partial [Rhizobiales bacterium]|nr:NfeD family protein [Hyphomicrobiales bacterium]
MDTLLSFFGPWTWFIIAIALFLLELLAAGVFFIWL